jgi:hypothetical protein
MSSCGLAGLSVADSLQPTQDPLQIRCKTAVAKVIALRLDDDQRRNTASRSQPDSNANRFASLAGGECLLTQRIRAGQSPSQSASA